MKKFRLAHCYSLAISFLLLTFQVQTVENEIYVSKEELHEILDNADQRYVYLGEQFSDLYRVVSRINELEENEYSIIGELKKHIEDGFAIGLYDAVLKALEYAESTLEENVSKLDLEESQEIANELAVVINQFVNDALTINTKKLLSQTEVADNSMITRSCVSSNCNTFSDGCPLPRCCIEPIKVVKVRTPLEVWGNARFKKNVQIDGKLKVYGKSDFKDDVKFEDEVKFKDDVVFKEDVLIEGDLTVDGTVTFNGPIQGLTIIDVVIETLSATDIVVENLSAVDANIQNLTVTDLVVLSCMDSLCVNNLSVVDEVVSGTLSVNDEIVNNITAITLSATDAVIANLSVTDLAVASCIDNLCVNNLSVGEIVITSCVDTVCATNLSVVDVTVTGTASINDAIINNATITTLSATDAVINNLSVTDLTVLSCMDSLCVNNLSVGDIVILSCLDSLCVNDLSAVDASISGTLSVTDIIADNITTGTLSATDGVIGNLSVTDLAVADCIDNLCVTNLSVTDVFAGSLSLCDLIVSCDIFMQNTTGPAIGNIMKAGNRFIHNAGTDNTFVGVNAGNFTTAGAENVGIGRNALFSNTTGFNDTSVGAFSMNSNTIGADNAAYGSYALVNNIQGSDNVALGNYTLVTNTTGLGNTAVGFQAGYSLGIGNNNSFMGNNAGLNLADGFTNVIIGYNSGLSLTTGDDNIYIANPGVATETGVIRIGTPATHIATFVQGIFGTAVQGTGIPVFVDANGQLGTVVSSQRFKHDIQDMGMQSEDIYKLRPVTFVYNNDATDTVQYGLIAEEVDEAFPALVVYDEDGQPYTVRYQLLPQLLLNELQKLNAVVQDQAITIDELRMDTALLNAAMSKVMARLNLQ
jgi:hypothetical protein